MASQTGSSARRAGGVNAARIRSPKRLVPSRRCRGRSITGGCSLRAAQTLSISVTAMMTPTLHIPITSRHVAALIVQRPVTRSDVTGCRFSVLREAFELRSSRGPRLALCRCSRVGPGGSFTQQPSARFAGRRTAWATDGRHNRALAAVCASLVGAEPDLKRTVVLGKPILKL
jgi:hypothetical protein